LAESSLRIFVFRASSGFGLQASDFGLQASCDHPWRPGEQRNDPPNYRGQSSQAHASGGRGPREAARGQVVEFNRDIRPLLSDNCYTCHGPDKARRSLGGSSEKGKRSLRHEGLIGTRHEEEIVLFRRALAESNLRLFVLFCVFVVRRVFVFHVSVSWERQLRKRQEITKARRVMGTRHEEEIVLFRGALGESSLRVFVLFRVFVFRVSVSRERQPEKGKRSLRHEG
jgi:hypothetical protein